MRSMIFKIALLLCFSVPISLQAQDSSSDLTKITRSDFQGPVKKITKHSADIIQTSTQPVTGEKRLWSIETYGREKNIRSYHSYHKDKLRKKWIYKWDNRGNLITYALYDDQDQLIGKRTYCYDDSDQVTKRRIWDVNNTDLSGHVHSYKNEGRLIEKTTYRANGILFSKIHYFYSKNKNESKLVKKTRYKKNGVLSSKSYYTYSNNKKHVRVVDKHGYLDYKKIITYNENGDILLEQSFNESLKQTSRHEYDYDDQGRLTEHRLYHSDKLFWVEKYTYNPENNRTDRIKHRHGKFEHHYAKIRNEQGDVIESIRFHENGILDRWIQFAENNPSQWLEILGYDKSGNLEYRETRDYDEFGNVISETRYEPLGLIESCDEFHYKYDHHNNWIERTLYRFFRNENSSYMKPLGKVLREIKYYEE